MKMVVVTVAAVLLLNLTPAPPGKDRGKELAALEQKLIGAWKGQGGCDGRIVFRADRTYELTGYGPGNDDSAGTWKVRWDALPATLVLTCTKSEVTEEIGKALEVKLVELDDRNLAFKYPNPNGSPSGRYAREKK